MAPPTHNKSGGGCGWRSWIVATILYNGLFLIFLALVPLLQSVSDAAGDRPTTCSVELAGVQGLQQPAPSPAAGPPVFDLILHVSNGRGHQGGDVVVSYAGVPLARGRTPSLDLGSREAMALPVKRTSAGVGVPGDLFRVMAEERRWGVAQLQVEFGVASDSFVCDVQLDSQQRVFDCY